jgi:excisionase family DNA binding protein
MSKTGLEAVEAQLREIRALLVQQQMAPAAVSLEEAARLLSCSTKHVSRMVKSGELVLANVGSLRRVPMSEIHRITSRPEVGQAPARARPLVRSTVSAEHRVRELLKLKPKRR